MQDFNQAITVNPNDAAAYLGRGNLLRSENDFNDALADLNQAIRLNPEGAQAYHARGLIYQRQGNDVQAITDFNNAIDRDPFAGAPYQARGQSLMATGKYEAAIEDFNAALNVDANNSEAWAGLGFCYEKLDNRAKAIESYQRAVRPILTTRKRRAALQRLELNSCVSPARSREASITPPFAGLGLQKLFQPVNIVLAILHVGVSDQRAKERQRRFNAVDDEFVERAAKAHQRLGASSAVDDQLADQRIVIRRDHVTLIGGRIDANAETAGGWK